MNLKRISARQETRVPPSTIQLVKFNFQEYAQKLHCAAAAAFQ